MQVPISDEELELMRLIDRCHLELPFYGSRRIRTWLFDEHGLTVNRKRIQRPLRTMSIETLYPKRNLSLANQKHKMYPYLLRNLVIDRPNQVWCTDVTYIPMAKGFVPGSSRICSNDYVAIAQSVFARSGAIVMPLCMSMNLLWGPSISGEG